MLLPFNLSAEVYKCIKFDGTVYYQAKYCDNASDTQTPMGCHEVTRKKRRTSAEVKHEKCEEAKQQIKKIRQRYKSGYTLQQGITMDRRLEKLQEKRQKYCTDE